MSRHPSGRMRLRSVMFIEEESREPPATAACSEMNEGIAAWRRLDR